MRLVWPENVMEPGDRPRFHSRACVDEFGNPLRHGVTLIGRGRFNGKMPTYVYETVPRTADEEPRRFEIRQGMKDAPLTEHPDDGTPVRRVVSGGFGYLKKGGSSTSRPGPAAAPG